MSIDDKLKQCHLRFRGTNKNYCGAEIEHECPYKDIMQGKVFAYLNNLPIFLPKCAYWDKVNDELAEQWLEEYK